MRATSYIFILFLAAFLTTPAIAQVTAVMQAKVEIISGAAFTISDHSIIDLSAAEISEFEALNFSLTSSPDTEVDITVNQSSELKNEFGEIISLESLHLAKKDAVNGKQDVSVQGKLKDGQQLNGKYQGTFTAVVEYL